MKKCRWYQIHKWKIVYRVETDTRQLKQTKYRICDRCETVQEMVKTERHNVKYVNSDNSPEVEFDLRHDCYIIKES